MPLIIPANTLSADDYEIDNSGCFGDTGTFLTRSQSDNESDTDRRKFTISLWMKQTLQGDAGGWHGLWSACVDSNNYTSLKITSDNVLVFGLKVSGTEITWTSTQKFRDPSAWYSLVVAYDSTDGTAANRLKIYVNGSQITGTFSSDLGQNVSAHWGDDASAGRVGAYNNNTGDSYMMNGYLADVCCTVGYALAPTAFGKTNDNGVWIPKKPSVTYSANGFFLEFKQTGTSANASGIGADTSGNTNHFTIDSDDTSEYFQTTDTPTNNFATLNRLANTTEAGGTFDEGNLKFVTNQADYSYRPSSIGVSAGKWYCEIKAVSFGGGSDPFMIGITSTQPTANSNELGHFANDWGYKEDQQYRNNNSNTSYGDSYTSGDIIGIALDLTNNKLYFSKNGTWQNSGVPTSGSTGTGAISITAVGSTPLENYFFAIGDYDNSSGSTSTFQANFGNPSFSISSGNADDNGYGNFEYDVPTGYYALCTKNLAEFG